MKMVAVKLVTDTVWDYVALVIQLVITAILFTLTAYVCMIVDQLRSVATRDNIMTLFITVSCVIWMWSAFVSDMHLSVFLALNRWGCVLWDFWFQYAFGLNLVFTFIIIKLNWYRLVQEHQNSVRIRNQTLSIIMFCMLPILIVCMGVEYNAGSSVDKKTGICMAQIGWKYALISTLLVNYACVLYLIYLGMRYEYVTRAHRELLYGTIIASSALLTILILNLTQQTIHVYGRVLKSICIDISCLSLFLGLVGVPILHSLKNKNEYELAMHVKSSDIQGSSEIKSVVDLLPYDNAYQHYLSWIIHVYASDNNAMTVEKSSLSPVLELEDCEVMIEEFNDYSTITEKDPQLFLFHLLSMVRLIQRMDIAINSSRSPDIEWKNNIDKLFIQDNATSRVRLPHRLQQLLLQSSTDYLSNYKNLLLCTKLWLLAQIEMLTWTHYVSNKETGLQNWMETIQSPSVREYVLEETAHTNNNV